MLILIKNDKENSASATSLAIADTREVGEVANATGLDARCPVPLHLAAQRNPR
jgi:hypothetical protein